MYDDKILRRNQSVPEGRENLCAPSLPGLKYRIKEQHESAKDTRLLHEDIQRFFLVHFNTLKYIDSPSFLETYVKSNTQYAQQHFFCN